MVRRGRRFALLAIMCAACTRGTRGLVIVAEAQSIGAWLRERVAIIESGARGRDRGVDARIRACSSSLDVFDIAISRAAQIEEDQIRELLAPFFERYGELIAELDAEGIRRGGHVIDDAGDTLASAPSRLELERALASRLAQARA